MEGRSMRSATPPFACIQAGTSSRSSFSTRVVTGEIDEGVLRTFEVVSALIDPLFAATAVATA